ADRAAQLSPSRPHRDLRVGRGLLQEVLLPPVEDPGDRRRNAYLLGHAGAPPARGRGVLPVPAHPRRHDRVLMPTLAPAQRGRGQGEGAPVQASTLKIETRSQAKLGNIFEERRAPHLPLTPT